MFFSFILLKRSLCSLLRLLTIHPLKPTLASMILLSLGSSSLLFSSLEITLPYWRAGNPPKWFSSPFPISYTITSLNIVSLLFPDGSFPTHMLPWAHLFLRDLAQSSMSLLLQFLHILSLCLRACANFSILTASFGFFHPLRTSCDALPFTISLFQREVHLPASLLPPLTSHSVSHSVT